MPGAENRFYWKRMLPFQRFSSRAEVANKVQSTRRNFWSKPIWQISAIAAATNRKRRSIEIEIKDVKSFSSSFKSNVGEAEKNIQMSKVTIGFYMFWQKNSSKHWNYQNFKRSNSVLFDEIAQSCRFLVKSGWTFWLLVI